VQLLLSTFQYCFPIPRRFQKLGKHVHHLFDMSKRKKYYLVVE
jgi:hypothetical protein